MRDELNPDDPRNLWQSQKSDEVTITLEQVRARAARFEKRIRRRNFREYAAGVVVIVFFTVACWLRHLHGWQLAPPALLIAGMIYVMFQLHRRAAVHSVPADADTRTLIAFHRRELERQRDAARRVWNWYLAPFLPGFAAFTAEAWIASGVTTRLGVGVGAIVLVLAGVWALNQHAARKLENKIQEWKSMEVSNE
jgi:hypothetical protein